MSPIPASESSGHSAPSNPARPRGGQVRLAIKLLVTVAALGLVMMMNDLSQIADVLQSQNPALLVWAAIAVILQVAFGSQRWRAVLMASAKQVAADISSRAAFGLFYASIFFNSFLPGTFGGDVVRAVMTRSLGVTTGAAVHSVVLDRVLALLILLLMAVPALPLVWQSIGPSPVFLLALVLAGPIAFAGYGVLRHVPALASLRLQVDRLVLSFWQAVRNLFSKVRPLLVASVAGFAAHAASCMSMYWIAVSLQVDITLFQAMTLVPLILLFSALPISIGGWGVREIGAIGLLGLIGVDSSQALVISLQFGLISLLMSLPGAIFWLSMRPRDS